MRYPFLSRFRFPQRLAPVFSIFLTAQIRAADFNVTTTADSGAGSLRQAILDANASPGADVVKFTLAQGTINISGTLPEITESLTMDPGSGRVQILSAGASAGASILSLNAGGCTVRNLTIGSSAPDTVLLTMRGEGGNLLEGILIGYTSPANLSTARHGMVVESNDNILRACLVSGSIAQDNIRVTGSRNQLVNNQIGPVTPGSHTFGTPGLGIHLLGGSDNVIGAQGRAVDMAYSNSANPPGANLIGSNPGGGIHIEGGSGHRILANGIAYNTGFGVKIDGGASNIEVNGAAFLGQAGANHLSVTGPATGVRILNCRVEGGLNSLLIGNAVRDLTIAQCQFEHALSGAPGVGIRLQGGDTPLGPVTIRENTIEGYSTGILVEQGMGLVTIGTREDGSSAASNVIWNNQKGALVIRDPSARVRVSGNYLSNRVSANPSGAPALNLQPSGEADGLDTANDSLDSDSGPNGLQNKPVLNSLSWQADGTIQIKGTLHSKPLSTYTIEALGGTASGSGAEIPQGALLATASVSTDANGNAEFVLGGSGCLPGWAVYLTATSVDGETSECGNELICPSIPPANPVLAAQTSLSLPESESATGRAFTLLRPDGVSGNFSMKIGITPDYPGTDMGVPGYISSDVAPHLRYRFSPSQPWTDLAWPGLGWSTNLDIPFNSGEDQRQIYLTAVDDQSWDPTGKPCILTLNSGNATYRIPVTFLDNDPPPNGILVRTNGEEIGSRTEQSASTWCIIKQDRISSVETAYFVTVDNGETTATLNQDFSIGGKTEITVRPRRTESSYDIAQFLTFSVLEDTLVEESETVALRVTSTTAGVNSESLVKIVITDNDFAKTSIADASVVEGDSGLMNLVFPVTLDQAVFQPVILNWETLADGTASSGTDFIAASGTVTIPAGATASTITVQVTGDTVLENDETLRVKISSSSASDIISISKAEAVGTILNDDLPSVSIANVSIPESVSSISFTASLSQPAPFNCLVSYTVSSGTALLNSDFTCASTGTLYFPSGSTKASFAVAIFEDSTQEADEAFSVKLYMPNKLTIGSGTAVVTILNDDFPALGSPSQQTVLEQDTGFLSLVSVPLQLSKASASPSSVQWQVTGDSTAVRESSGTVTFAAGATTAVIELSVPGNLTPQATREVKLAFINPVNLTVPPSSVSVLLVQDNDQRTVAATGFSTPEKDSGYAQGFFRLTMNAALEVPVRVDYQTVDGSAKAGSDYVAAEGTATIPAGATEVEIPVLIHSDTEYENNESFTLALSNPVNALLGATEAIGSLLNDDSQPGVSVDPAVVTASSSGGPFRAWLEVKLQPGTNAPKAPVSFKVSTRDGTALAGTHYTAISSGTLTFQPGRTTEWIAVPVSESGGEIQTRNFFVDFQPSDASGGVATVSAEITVEPLRILSFEPLLPGLFYLQFPTGKGQNYLIQEAETLTGPWTDNSSILQGSGSPVFQTVVSSKTKAYFRVRAFHNPPATPAALSP